MLYVFWSCVSYEQQQVHQPFFPIQQATTYMPKQPLFVRRHNSVYIGAFEEYNLYIKTYKTHIRL